MTTLRPVAITGLDAVLWPGHGIDAAWEALRTGRRPTGPVARVAEPLLRHAIPADLESQAKFLNGASQLAAHVVGTAADAAGLAAAGLADGAKGMCSAQIDPTVIDYASYREAMREATEGFTHAAPLDVLNAASVRKMNPFYLLETLNNNAFSLVSAWHGLRGANTSLSGWKVIGLEAVSLAARGVARGDAAASVALGAARYTGDVIVMEIAHLGVLPAGVLPADGAAALVLEPADAAHRGADVAIRVVGHGTGFGAGTRLADAVRATAAAACAGAGLRLDDVGTVLADDAATVAALGVRARARVHREVLGEAGPGSEVADVALAATMLRRGIRPDGTPAGTSALVIATGLEGQVAAVLLARVG